MFDSILALEERYQTTLQRVLDGWDSNDFAEIVMKDGKAMLDLSKDEHGCAHVSLGPTASAESGADAQ